MWGARRDMGTRRCGTSQVLEWVSCRPIDPFYHARGSVGLVQVNAHRIGSRIFRIDFCFRNGKTFLPCLSVQSHEAAVSNGYESLHRLRATRKSDESQTNSKYSHLVMLSDIPCGRNTHIAVTAQPHRGFETSAAVVWLGSINPTARGSDGICYVSWRCPIQGSRH